MINEFPPEVCDAVKYYVYRLIDPRNGQTFYVGKGKGNRVFDHIRDPSALVETEVDGGVGLKIQTIREINKAGLTPLHVIHRHGMDEAIAFEVEAALIDAYPGLTNIAGGYYNYERGCRHADEIMSIYSAMPLVAHEPLTLIFIGKALDEGQSIYHAVRCAWKMSKTEAEKRRLVLAYDGGLVKGAFRPEKWLAATPKNFPELPADFDKKRIGFIGKPANDVWDMYVGKRPPQRKKGARSPFTYIDPQ